MCKGGHHRVVPAANRFFEALGACLQAERPATAGTDRVFVVRKGPRRRLPLPAEGLREILGGARRRAGLGHGTCHELRHTCLTRLREAGMALEAVQAQAGHLSIESTRVYLHLGSRRGITAKVESHTPTPKCPPSPGGDLLRLRS